MCDPLSTSARMAGGGFAMASPYGCGESSKKGSLHGVIEKLPYFSIVKVTNCAGHAPRCKMRAIKKIRFRQWFVCERFGFVG